MKSNHNPNVTQPHPACSFLTVETELDSDFSFIVEMF